MKWRIVIYEQMKFNQRIQREGESVESFITDLYALSKRAITEGSLTR